jgi:hypothetical protein
MKKNMNESGQDSIRRVFTEVFSARDIAEPLVSFDSVIAAADARAKMEVDGFDAVGVRRDGLVRGYVERQDLEEGSCGDRMKEFESEVLISDSTSLAEVIRGLSTSDRLFVKVFGSVGGIVTKSDLQKPAVRMWLFGMVTLIEMRFTRLIQSFCPQESWHQFLSPSRLQKAEELRAERLRRNQQVRLIDCIQFSDKGQILARNKEIRRMTRFESRRQVEEAFKGLERLRNNLAHSQDIVSSDWEIILRLVENLERVIRGPSPRGSDQAV